jgi:hypothetical protein
MCNLHPGHYFGGGFLITNIALTQTFFELGQYQLDYLRFYSRSWESDALTALLLHDPTKTPYRQLSLRTFEPSVTWGEFSRDRRPTAENAWFSSEAKSA